MANRPDRRGIDPRRLETGRATRPLLLGRPDRRGGEASGSQQHRDGGSAARAPVRTDRDREPVRVGRSQKTGGNSPATPERSSSDRKSTRLNSSHVRISYAVFCLKKKKK